MLEQVCQLARNAGDAIMQVYDGAKPMEYARKQDDSPVTAADIAAHTVILEGLRTLTPDIPVLSEEDPPAWEVRQHWQRYWLSIRSTAPRVHQAQWRIHGQYCAD